MFKLLFSKKDSIDKLGFPEFDIALRLMFEMAMSDGHLDKTIKKINDTYQKEEKKELLRKLWALVAVDKIVDPYEEGLYFQIADLIYVERAKANQIKQENS